MSFFSDDSEEAGAFKRIHDFDFDDDSAQTTLTSAAAWQVQQLYRQQRDFQGKPTDIEAAKELAANFPDVSVKTLANHAELGFLNLDQVSDDVAELVKNGESAFRPLGLRALVVAS
ncbi:hypothetical protein NBRC10513_001306 [Rhodotorula toruloides]